MQDSIKVWSSVRPLAAILFVVLLFTGCASSESAADRDRALYEDKDSVTSEDIDRMHAVRVEDLLVGRVAGVHVSQTASGIRVVIRGPSSILGSSEPLYVIDGMPIEPNPGGALTGINPRDIESIRVLKNASDTAFYGIRGANGVVVITTKRPPPPPKDVDEEKEEDEE